MHFSFTKAFSYGRERTFTFLLALHARRQQRTFADFYKLSSCTCNTISTEQTEYDVRELSTHAGQSRRNYPHNSVLDF